MRTELIPVLNELCDPPFRLGTNLAQKLFPLYPMTLAISRVPFIGKNSLRNEAPRYDEVIGGLIVGIGWLSERYPIEVAAAVLRGDGVIEIE